MPPLCYVLWSAPVTLQGTRQQAPTLRGCILVGQHSIGVLLIFPVCSLSWLEGRRQWECDRCASWRLCPARLVWVLFSGVPASGVLGSHPRRSCIFPLCSQFQRSKTASFLNLSQLKAANGEVRVGSHTRGLRQESITKRQKSFRSLYGLKAEPQKRHQSA